MGIAETGTFAVHVQDMVGDGGHIQKARLDDVRMERPPRADVPRGSGQFDRRGEGMASQRTGEELSSFPILQPKQLASALTYHPDGRLGFAPSGG